MLFNFKNRNLLISCFFSTALFLSISLKAADRVIPTAPEDYLSKENLLNKKSGDEKAKGIKKGASLYQSKCLKCHGESLDGKGKSAAGLTPPVPSFIEKEYLKNRKDGQLFWIIEKGSMNTDMEAFGKGTNYNISDDDIWNIIAYLRDLSDKLISKSKKK